MHQYRRKCSSLDTRNRRRNLTNPNTVKNLERSPKSRPNLYGPQMSTVFELMHFSAAVELIITSSKLLKLNLILGWPIYHWQKSARLCSRLKTKHSKAKHIEALAAKTALEHSSWSTGSPSYMAGKTSIYICRYVYIYIYTCNVCMLMGKYWKYRVIKWLQFEGASSWMGLAGAQLQLAGTRPELTSSIAWQRSSNYLPRAAMM